MPAILTRVESHAAAERLPAPAQTRAATLARVASPAVLLACVLVGAWLVLDPRSPDLAAQTYRAALFAREGMSVWDNNWYGGHHLPGYSLVFPWLALAVGIRAVGAITVLVSTLAFERVALAAYGPRARWGAACFALAAAGDLWIGRITFAVGVTFAVLAVLALTRSRAWVAAGLTALSAATSPVAGLLLGLAGASWALASIWPRNGRSPRFRLTVADLRQRRGAGADASTRARKRAWAYAREFVRSPAVLALALPALAVVLPLEALFPEGGWEPFAASSVTATLAVTLAFLYALPRGERTLRIGGWAYLGVTLLSIAPTPMGSNIDRYAVLLAGPLLLCALRRDGWRQNGRPLAGTVAAVALIVVWTGWGPVRESSGVVGDPSTRASYYTPLERFLDAHGGSLVRVEVPFTHSHWEAALLAGRYSLARGWERQLDTKYDPVFFKEGLTPRAYAAWLHEDAVSYVALPDVRLDGSSDEEAALIRHGEPFLREAMRSKDWRVFEVLGSPPLASPPARLTELGHDSFGLRFGAAGRSLVRVRYTRYWTVVSGAACVEQAPGGWTWVDAQRRGWVRVAARFTLARAFGLAGGCGVRAKRPV